MSERSRRSRSSGLLRPRDRLRDRQPGPGRLQPRDGPGPLWFISVLGGWGIGLVAHGVYALGSGRFLGEAWQERKIREEMDRELRRSR